jgi:ABC-2 type transport system ATP-binding protein
MEEIEGIGVKIVDLSVRQNTLEDVFIELTGSTLRE